MKRKGKERNRNRKRKQKKKITQLQQMYKMKKIHEKKDKLQANLNKRTDGNKNSDNRTLRSLYT